MSSPVMVSSIIFILLMNILGLFGFILQKLNLMPLMSFLSSKCLLKNSSICLLKPHNSIEVGNAYLFFLFFSNMEFIFIILASICNNNMVVLSINIDMH